MQDKLIVKLATLPWYLKILTLSFVYLLFCWIGTFTFYRDFGIAIYWPAAGVAILGVYVLGRNAIPGIFISAFFINFLIYFRAYTSFSSLFISVFAIAAANTLAAFLGSQCLRQRVLKQGRSFFQLDSVLAFLLFVVFIPSLITSVTGGVVTYFYGVMPDFFTKTHAWFLSDFIGIIIILPLVISWIESPEIKINRKKIPEFIVIIFLLFISNYFIFTDFFGNYLYSFIIAYFTLPIYFWLALRFDSKAITTLLVLSLLLIGSLAIYSGNEYLGALIAKPYTLLQGFSILISILTLAVHSIFMERQQSLVSLHKSEEDLKDILVNLPLSVGILDKTFNPLFLNKEFIGKTGLKSDDFKNHKLTYYQDSAPESRVLLLHNAWESFIETKKPGESQEKDISLLTNDHLKRDFSLNISPLKDRYLMVMMDITQRKQLLERIRENERKLSSLIQNLIGMVYQRRLDRKMTMEFVSEGAFLLTGYLPSDLVFNSLIPFVSIVHERFRDYIGVTIEKALKNGDSYSLQYQIFTKGGELKWVAENGNGIFGSDGICRSLEGFIHDITERVETLETIKKGEEKYRTLFENMPVSLWEDDYSDIRKSIDSWPQELKSDVSQTLKDDNNLFRKLISKIKIVDMNRSSLQLYGETDKSKLGESVPDIFSSGDSDAFSSVLASFYEGKSSLEERIMEVKIKKKKRFLSVRWFIMPGYEESLSRILVTILDISDLKKAEKEIHLLNHRLEKKVEKRTRDLNRANLELEAFSYSVSHDLKAPLRAVRGFSALLLEEYGNDLPEGAVHYIKNVQKNTVKMTHLITDLLQFSRLGSKSLVYSTIDSYRLVKIIWDDLYSLQKPAEIEFIVNQLPKINADESLITQVFVNLFSNAVKFSKAGQPGRIEVSCLTNSEFHEFCVIDQGIGFDQKHADKIFKVFQRLHSHEEFEGNGVGLALVQRIIHRHGGVIFVKSQRGHGTSMFFRIPVEIDNEYV